MGFQILYYGNDRTSRYEGERLMGEIMNKNYENENVINNFLKIIRNREWYEASRDLIKNNKPPLPYPSSIITKINQSFDNVAVDILPRLCYMVIYVDNDVLDEFLRKNFKNMIK